MEEHHGCPRQGRHRRFLRGPRAERAKREGQDLGSHHCGIGVMMKSFKYRTMFLAIGISCAVMIAVSLWRDDMNPILIIHGFLGGMSLISFVMVSFIERQNTLIDDLLSQNLDLIGKNRTLIELNL